MSAAIQATGRPMIIQIGAGDHMPLLTNPNSTAGGDSYARSFADQAWVWGPEVAHTWYTGSDKQNTWESTLHNVLQNYRGAEFFQKPGAWNFAGDLWCGTAEHGTPVVGDPGGKTMTVTEEHATYALFTIMAAPPMLGCDIRRLSAETLAYLSNTELLAVNQDKWGLQGSIVGLGDGSQIIAKPLSDGAYALALWNTGGAAANVSAAWKLLSPSHTGSSMTVRDIWNRRDLGVHEGGFSAMVPGHGVTIIKATPAMTCRVGEMAGGDMHVANLTLAAAAAWCRTQSKCAGFSVEATCQASPQAVFACHFKDAWGARRPNANASWSAWSEAQ